MDCRNAGKWALCACVVLGWAGWAAAQPGAASRPADASVQARLHVQRGEQEGKPRLTLIVHLPDGITVTSRPADGADAAAKVKEARGNWDAPIKVVIAAEGDVRMGEVADVYRALQAAGLTDVSFEVAGKVAPPGPGPAPASRPASQPATEPEPAPVSFFGAAAKARRVIYVIDRSGSMFDTFDFVRHELKRSIGALAAGQEFQVLLFTTGAPQVGPYADMAPATPAAIAATGRFLANTVAEGQTKPWPTIRRALSTVDADGRHADVIYLLTDGEFDPEIVKRIAQLQAQRTQKAAIHTIGFVYRSGERVLKQIAEANGGTYTFIRSEDLKR